MALVPVFGHGFDNLQTSDLSVLFPPPGGGWSTNYNVVTTGGRGGGRYAQITNTNSLLPIPVPTSVDTYAFGFGLMVVSYIIGWSIWNLADNATMQLSLNVRSDRRLEIRRGDQTGTVLGIGSAVMSSSIWQHVQVWTKINSVSGRVVVTVNGIVDIDTGAGGVNTQASGNAYATRAIYGCVNGGSNGIDLRFDDIWQATAASTAAGTGYGDLNFEAKVPNGAGTTTNFTPSTGANWQNVDDIPHNSDTDYNSSNTVGNKDTFAMTDLVATVGSVSFIMIETFDRKEDAGTALFRHVLRMGGTESEGADFSPAQSASYGWHGSCFDVKPGGGAITLSDANAMECGYKYAA